jgi:hypothetical protein
MTRLLVRPESNERVPVSGCCSEAMMFMGLAGKPIEIAIVSDRFINGQPAPGFMAQVYLGGRPFSAPLTIGEAGFYLDDVGYYTYRD